MKGDVTKLPKWAQREIGRLERDVEHLKGQLSAGPEDSDTFANAFSAARRPLGAQTDIEFVLANGKIRARIEPGRGVFGRLYISGDDGLRVMPNAFNSIELEIGR